jgi:hypothetical protein
MGRIGSNGEAPRISSRAPHHISATDIDMLLHRYNAGWDRVNHPNRLINHFMIIETKTRMGEPTFSQTDTYILLDKMIMRNKYGKQTCETYHEVNEKGQKVSCKWWGVHLLQFTGTNPEDSQKGIFWDKQNIDQYRLEQLLRFDINPFTFAILNDRRHHKKTDGVWTS